MIDEMKISFWARALFTIRKMYNRTIGEYIIRWDIYGLTLFGFSFISKRTLADKFSKESVDRLRGGLTDAEFQEFCMNTGWFQTFPRPGLPNYVYTERQLADYGIIPFGDHFYIFQFK